MSAKVWCVVCGCKVDPGRDPKNHAWYCAGSEGKTQKQLATEASQFRDNLTKNPLTKEKNPPMKIKREKWRTYRKETIAEFRGLLEKMGVKGAKLNNLVAGFEDGLSAGSIFFLDNGVDFDD